MVRFDKVSPHEACEKTLGHGRIDLEEDGAPVMA